MTAGKALAREEFVMLRQASAVGTTLIHLFIGAALGALPGAFYAGLVGTVHLGVYGRWDRLPDFAVACVAAGALLGLGAAAWALSSRRAPGGLTAPPAGRRSRATPPRG
jgi:hypothetical protein